MNLSTSCAAAMLSAGDAQYNNGTLVFYSGAIPATPETAATGTVLTTFTFSATAFGAPTFSGGLSSALASLVSTTSNPVASGTVGYARAFQSGGVLVVADFTVGTSGTDITIGNTGIQTGVPVTMSSFQLRLPAL